MSSRRAGIFAMAIVSVGVAVSISGAEPALTNVVMLASTGGTAVVGSQPYRALSCVSVSDCVAVGPSESGLARTSAAAATSSGAEFSSPRVITLPDNASVAPGESGSALSAVSCWALGECVAVGDYLGTESVGALSGVVELPLVVSETAGVWERAVTLDLPTDDYHEGALLAVSCDLAGDCTVAGYLVSQTSTGVSVSSTIVDTEFGGSDAWVSPASALGEPAGPAVTAIPSSISCADAGDCTMTAVSTSPSDLTARPFVYRETASVWSSPRALVVPTAEAVVVEGLDCPDQNDCVAVGTEAPSASDLSNHVGQRGAAAIEVAGTWSSLRSIDLPVLSPLVNGEKLFSVSCWSVGHCVAVGDGALAPSDLTTVPLALSLNNGAWSATHLQSNPAIPTYHGALSGALFSVVCVNASRCRAVGDVDEGTAAATGVGFGFVDDLTPVESPAPPGPPLSLQVVASRGGAAMSWLPPTNDGGGAISSFALTATSPHDPTLQCHSARFTCHVAGTVAHHTYRVTVVATNASGSSPPSAPVHFTAP